MARPVWSGTLGFGLVNVPVKLYTATEDHSIRFRQFDAETGEPVHHQRVTDSGKKVDYDDIQKGYEVSDGNFVILTQEELESVEPTRTSSIGIEDFVPLDEIDPIYFRATYFVAPEDQAAAKASYRLLATAMSQEQRVGIAMFVMRGKEHLAAVRPSDGRLVLETMYFGDEIRDPSRLPELDDLGETDERGQRELDMARKLVGSLSASWEPDRYADTYRERVLELIHRKAEGEEIMTEAGEEPEESNVVDLMSVLEASIEEVRSGSRGGGRDRENGRRSQGRERDEGWDELSKEQLYDEAQRHDIAGRSRMSKSELIEALRRAS